MSLNSMKKIYILFLIVPVLCIWYVAWSNQKPDYEPKTYETVLRVEEPKYRDGWCLKDVVAGGQGEVIIEEQQGGRYDYELYATSKGIEVWTPCE